jgi:DNA-binding response OmpR family regulator
MLEAGCDVAIPKPFSPEDLENAIRRATLIASAALLERVQFVS